MESEIRTVLLALAAELGDARQMSILGEGNVSGRLDEHHLLVKASGTSLGTLRPDELVKVDARPVRSAMAQGGILTDAEVNQLLMDVRTDPQALKPSVETLFHAWLLGLPSVSFVGHVHAIAVNAVLCSPHANSFAQQRVIPDQVVYCGPSSVLVPYVDPGIVLAEEIARRVETYRQDTGSVPRLVLLRNHGIIAMGAHAREVSAALSMAEKSARIMIQAMALGGAEFMAQAEVERIAARSDEHYRQRILIRDQ